MFSAAQFTDVPSVLLWDHCHGRCRRAPEGGGGAGALPPPHCCCTRQPLVDAGKNGSVVFVGAGLSAIEAAKVVLKAGGQPLLLERSAFMGGIWVSAANPESRVQVDPVSFRGVDDEAPVLQDRDDANPLDSRYLNRASVLSRLATSVEKSGLRARTVFNIELLSFRTLPNGRGARLRVRQAGTAGIDRPVARWPRGTAGEGEGDEGKPRAANPATPTAGTAAVAAAPCSCCAAADGEYEVDVAQLHLRTGSLTHALHRGDTLGGQYPRVAEFGGKLRRGMGGDVGLGEFAGKRVVVVGMGAFGVENVRRAIRGGAASVTVLSRRFDKLLFPERVSYLLRSRLQAEDAFEQANLSRMWADVYRLVHTVCSATGLAHAVLNDTTVRMVDGERHFVFSRGLPSMSSNCMFLAHHYGLVEVLQDEVVEFDGGGGVGLTTKAGRHLDADVLLLCVGFGTDERVLDGHVVCDSFFVDGTPAITHNLRGDRVNGQGLIGPRVRSSNFLISYYEDAQEYERPIVHMNKNPAVFAALRDMAPNKNYGVVSGVDYFTTLQLSEKLSLLADPTLRAILAENRRVRAAMYAQLLPEDAFLRLDRENWTRLAAHFAARTGKPVLAYPFENELQSAPQAAAAAAADGSAAALD